jgi:hypothetical protein
MAQVGAAMRKVGDNAAALRAHFDVKKQAARAGATS